MIKATCLTKKFGNFQVLRGIDLNVQRGEIYGFLGHNGAGKSTTMNILTGLSKADSGKCMVNGWNLNMIESPGDLHVGYLPEEPRFYSWMTAREILTYLGARWSKGSIRMRVDEMLDWVGLIKAADRRVGGYSRGMRQRLGMAAAMLYDSDLLLLDEPSSALDPEGRSDMLNMILDLKDRGKTVFLSTHILSDAERVCDRVGILTHGRMMVEKPLQMLLEENVKSIYDVLLCESIGNGIIDHLKTLPGVQGVDANRDRLSIEMESPQTSSRELLSYFASIDAVIRSFELRRASLEDIFLEEVGKGEQ